MLLTRAPLYSRGCPRFLVRLACVRHAASVDSEPGSNSRLKLGRHRRRAALRLRSTTPNIWSSPTPQNCRTGRLIVSYLAAERNNSLSFALCQRPEASELHALTWHAQLNCQRTILTRQRRAPHSGVLREPLGFTPLLALWRPPPQDNCLTLPDTWSHVKDLVKEKRNASRVFSQLLRFREWSGGLMLPFCVAGSTAALSMPSRNPDSMMLLRVGRASAGPTTLPDWGRASPTPTTCLTGASPGPTNGGAPGPTRSSFPRR